MYIFAEPITHAQIRDIQEAKSKIQEEYELSVLGKVSAEPESKENWADIKTKVEEEIENDELSSDDDLGMHPVLEEESSNGTSEATLLTESIAGGELGSTDGSEEAAGLNVESTTNDEPSARDESDVVSATDQDENLQLQAENGKPIIDNASGISGRSGEDSAETNGEVAKPEEPAKTAPDINAPASKTAASANSTGQHPRLLAMILTIRNKVDGKYVTRPTSLGPDLQWSVEYSLAEVDDQARAQNLYSACKRRREVIFNPDDDRRKDYDGYRRKVRELVNRGKNWRRQQDIVDCDKGEVVYKPMTQGSVAKEQE